MDGGGSESDATLGFEPQLDALRLTVKWLVAGLAAVAAVMIGGLQLASIGRLPATSWRLYVALFAAGIALGAVGYMLKEATALLSQEWLTLALFSDATVKSILQPKRTAKTWKQDVKNVRKQVEESRHELYRYAALSLEDLHAKLQDAEEVVFDPATAADAMAKVIRLRRAGREVVQYANYCLAVISFQRLRAKIAWAAMITAIAVAVFAYAANPAPAAPPLQVQVGFKQ